MNAPVNNLPLSSPVVVSDSANLLKCRVAGLSAMLGPMLEEQLGSNAGYGITLALDDLEEQAGVLEQRIEALEETSKAEANREQRKSASLNALIQLFNSLDAEQQHRVINYAREKQNLLLLRQKVEALQRQKDDPEPVPND